MKSPTFLLLSNPSLQSWGITLVRIAVGIVFIVHGSDKLFNMGVSGVAFHFGKAGIPLPMVSAILATSAEFGGGTLLLLGLFTRLAAIPVGFTMLVAWITVHKTHFMLSNGGFEYVMVLLAANLMFIIAGPGRLALDNLIARRQRDWC